jgi:hypothetical protein
MVTLEQWAAMCGQTDVSNTPPATNSASSQTTAASPSAWPQRTTALSVAGMPKIKRNRILPEPEDELKGDADEQLDAETAHDESDGDHSNSILSDDDEDADFVSADEADDETYDETEDESDMCADHEDRIVAHSIGASEENALTDPHQRENIAATDDVDEISNKKSSGSVRSTGSPTRRERYMA